MVLPHHPRRPSANGSAICFLVQRWMTLVPDPGSGVRTALSQGRDGARSGHNRFSLGRPPHWPQIRSRTRIPRRGDCGRPRDEPGVHYHRQSARSSSYPGRGILGQGQPYAVPDWRHNKVLSQRMWMVFHRRAASLEICFAACSVSCSGIQAANRRLVP